MPKQVRPSESEKISINVGYVDLGRIDLLVEEGFYANRADFLRTAIRGQFDRHASEMEAVVARRTLDLGLREIGRAELERAVADGVALHVKVVGLARIASDVTPGLARDAIATITVLGALQASDDIKNALRDRIR